MIKRNNSIRDMTQVYESPKEFAEQLRNNRASIKANQESFKASEFLLSQVESCIEKNDADFKTLYDQIMQAQNQNTHDGDFLEWLRIFVHFIDALAFNKKSIKKYSDCKLNVASQTYGDSILWWDRNGDLEKQLAELRLDIKNLKKQNNDLKQATDILKEENKHLKKIDILIELRSWIDAARKIIAIKLGESFPEKLEKLKKQLRNQIGRSESDARPITIYWGQWMKLKEQEEGRDTPTYEISHKINEIVQTSFLLQAESWYSINTEFYGTISVQFHTRVYNKAEVLKLVDKVIPDDKSDERQGIRSLIESVDRLENKTLLHSNSF